MAVSKWQEVLIETAEYLIKRGRLPAEYRPHGATVYLVRTGTSEGMTRPNVLSNGQYVNTCYDSGITVERARQLLGAGGGKGTELQIAL